MFIKSKPTQYNGFKFRSRTEARWAVFFDALNIKYYYEYEDFILSEGKRYLPDFYLPDFDLFIEVKGKATDQEKDLLIDFHKTAKKTILLAEGVPDFKVLYQVCTEDKTECNAKYCDSMPLAGCSFWCDTGPSKTLNCQEKVVGCFYYFMPVLLFIDENRTWVHPGFENQKGFFNPDDWYDWHKRAVYKARSARFERFK